MTRTTYVRRTRALAAVATAAVLSLGTSSCSYFTDDAKDDKDTTAPTTQTEQALVDSQFTRDGTFQSHIEARDIEGMDFVYTLYPTKSTPRTNEWYPRGNKFYSFTFQAYDLSQKIRAPFDSKRKVYLNQIKVTSKTITVDGGPTQHPYKLDGVAKDLTFDPEPVSTKYGMLITSPKGAFELRNQKIGPMSLDTRGVELQFTATVFVQDEAGRPSYTRRLIKQNVPIQIFESDEPTDVASIPVDAN